MDTVKLDKPFLITCNRCGGPAELDKQDNPPMADCPKCGDLEREDFTVTCPNCGNTDPTLDNGVRCGSSWTGLYGTYDITCKCGNVETVFDP